MKNAAIEIVSPKLFPGVVADELVAAIGDAISESGTCSIVLSGGKTPASMYRELSYPPRVNEISWENVKIFWGDERFVPQDNVHSNFKIANDTLLENIPDPKPDVFGINTSLKTPEESASDYEKTIRKALSLKLEEMPIFDIVLLGVGDDGHIASIFPDSNLLSKKDWLCAAVKKDCGEYPRITLSPAALFSAKRIYFLVKGDAKSDIIKTIFEEDVSEHKVPAILYKQASERVTWFIDSEAANEVEQSLS